MTRALSFVAVVVFVALASSARATEPKAIAVEKPFARASVGQAKVGAAYLTIRNSGDSDRLLRVSGDAAEAIELHTHAHEGGVMRMYKVEAIDVPAKEVVVLQPGGLHVMLMGLRAPLKEGSRLSLTLHFAKAGAVTVEMPIEAAGARAPGTGMDGHKGGHGKH
jgi:copper(I)-binding protein